MFEIIFLQYFFDKQTFKTFPLFKSTMHERLLIIGLDDLRSKSWQYQKDMLGLQLNCTYYNIGVLSINKDILIALQNGHIRIFTGYDGYTIIEVTTGKLWKYYDERHEWIFQGYESIDEDQDDEDEY